MLPLYLFAVQAQVKNWNDDLGGGRGSCMVDGVPTLACFEIVFGNILFMASSLIVLVLFIMFVVGSFNYITSLGNPEKIKKAQGTLKYALYGFIVFVCSFLILNIIDILFLGGQGKLFNFTIGE